MKNLQREKMPSVKRLQLRLLQGAMAMGFAFSLPTFAEAPLLSAEEAFRFSVSSSHEKQAKLHWDIPEHYYLYQHKIELKQGSQHLKLDLPPAESIHDDNYGKTQVYYQQLNIPITIEPSQHYQVFWQGCAKDRLCYPPQKIEFQSDSSGLVTLQNAASGQKKLLDLSSSNIGQNSILDTASIAEVQKTEPNLNPISNQQFNNDQSRTNQTTSNSAQDQIWSEKLANSSFAYGMLLFFGLGLLLAFTPCSLPMLPILTSLLVREHRGLKAWMIALTFVCSMATVYALLGLIASSAGLNFQRWLQQPSTLIAFSALFVIFALNLFGLFDIRLPQRLINRLDHAQAMQQGGSLVSAGVMGMISALLVGPCMTAPLAGALLFISQTQSQWHGALLLFTLGFGMGVPLLLASILGSRILPKAGQWMNQIKVLFAFIMLALALYFIRPLLNEAVLQWLSLALSVGFVAYVLARIFWRNTQLKSLYILCLLVAVPYIAYSQYQQSQRFFDSENVTQNHWQVARTAAEFKQILAQAPRDRAIIIDVYADWCIACQPIEHRILKSADIQQALAPYYLIKLDLSQYDASHQALLNAWDILGPPTYLFLNLEQKEIRGLRLTGAFSEAELQQQLTQLKKHVTD